jgi:hypothetical protein
MSDTSIRDTAAGGMPKVAADTLAIYDLQKPFVEPLLRLCRLTNTALDTLFYDVGALTAALSAKGTAIDTGGPGNSGTTPRPLQTLDLTAATNPSGSIIIVDAQLAPYVRKPFINMTEFFDYANGPDGTGLHTVTITGVGSSAYGAVAFALLMSSLRRLAAGSASKATTRCRA